jgi:hypothetical protein
VSTVQKRVLTQDCMACNREHGQPMCDLCADMEQAEETASERRDDEPEADRA